MEDLKNKSLITRAIHGGSNVDGEYGAVSTPIYQTSTFAFKDADEGARRFSGEEEGYMYTRIGNPTINALEENIAILEGGYGAVATSSGMSAVTAIYFAFLSAGDHIISTSAVYGPTRNIMENEFSRFNIESTFVDTSNIGKIQEALKENTKVLLIETPANPTIVLTDIAECAKFAKDNSIILVVDNTFCTPYLQRPLELGADVSFHSVTKAINGHTDVVGGLIVPKTEELYKRIRKVMVSIGLNMDPHQAWLVQRGLKTMPMRVEYAQKGAMEVAKWIEEHPKVEWVKYPGLKSHPQHELAKKQMDGYGFMISFELKGGIESGKAMLANVELCTLAVSLGGIETLIQHPAGMTHSSVPREKRLKAGLTDGLVRISVGCETPSDIIEDLDKALSKV